MKKIMNIILATGIVFGLVSCKKEPLVMDLTLNSTTLEIDKAEIAKITIKTGNGRYVVESSDEMVAKAAISGTTVAILGVEGGETVVTITDELGKVETITVTVAFSVPRTATFVWNKETVTIGSTGGYGVSVLENAVALTDLNVPKQYFLSWDGGMSEGNKTNGTLIIAEPGIEPEPIELTSIRVVKAEMSGSYLVFNDGSRRGELFFSK